MNSPLLGTSRLGEHASLEGLRVHRVAVQTLHGRPVCSYRGPETSQHEVSESSCCLISAMDAFLPSQHRPNSSLV
jgi:hypothetical protein